jgi:hypothetical protein
VYGTTRPKLQLDNAPPLVCTWGETFLPTSPGPHRVRCYFRYTLWSYAGDASIDVAVEPNHIASIQYVAPMWFAYRPGSWTLQA